MTRGWLTAAAALGAVAACTYCGSSQIAVTDAGVPDGGKDGIADVGPEAAKLDAEVKDGWRSLADISPDCGAMWIPLDVKASVSKLSWLPCANGKADCLQVDTAAWRSDGRPKVVAGLFVSPNRKWVVIQRFLGDTTWEWDVYDPTTWEPMAAWKHETGLCSIGARPADVGVVAFAAGLPFIGSSGQTREAHMATPALIPFLPLPGTPQSQAVAASDTVVAFDTGPGFSILVGAPGSSAYVRTTAEQLQEPLVVQNDVFAFNEHGPDQWAREFRVKPDGAVELLRSAPQRNVDAFTSDGVTMFWAEDYGGAMGPIDPNPAFVELWAAPYTTSPATLAGTATKLATLTNARRPVRSVAFNGYAAFWGGHFTYVIRSDGLACDPTLSSERCSPNRPRQPRISAPA